MRDHQFHAVLDEIRDGVLIESGNRVTYLNSAYSSLLGYAAPRDLDGATIHDIAHPSDVERLEHFGACRAEGRPAPARYSFRACRRDGEVVVLDASVSASRVDGELLITTVVRPLAMPPLDALSEREREVIEHLLAGKRSKEIALLLNVSDKTVFTHRSRAFAKLGANGLADLFRSVSVAGGAAATLQRAPLPSLRDLR